MYKYETEILVLEGRASLGNQQRRERVDRELGADMYVNRMSDIHTRNASMLSSRSGLRRWTKSERRREGRGVIDGGKGGLVDCI